MKTAVQVPQETSHVVEHLFRHEAGKMVATLTRIFGLEHLTLAEDVVQEALARALRTWPYHGLPDNPAAWIMRASRNLALDVVRREKNFRTKEAEIVRAMERDSLSPEAPIFSDSEIADDRLRMMFVCCHPAIPADAQVALALKTLCGFSVAEISRAFLTTEAAMAKKLTRAKANIREAQIPFEIPAGEDLMVRLDSVLQSVYLLFNEGYKASSGEKLVRAELCEEAIRLTTLLVQHPAGDRPKTHALLALMMLNAARIATRQDDDGNLLRLDEQDRAQWNQEMIARGMYHLASSAAGEEMSEYHLEAGIAACHAAATDYRSTDWQRILVLYDRLLRFNPSPVTALNRAIVVANIHGAKAGLEAVAAIRTRDKLDAYYLLYAVVGELEFRLNNRATAAEQFGRALRLADTTSERTFLSTRLEACRVNAHEKFSTTLS